MATLDRPRLHAGFLVLAISLSFAGAAAAAPPTLGGGGAGPEEQACAGRTSGDPCTLPNNQLGTCGPGTCSRLDYSGGSPPKAIEESCLVCKPASAQAEGQAEGGGQTGAEPAPVDPGASSTKGGPHEPPESSSRCRLAGDSPTPAGLALLAGLLFVARRRRR